MKGAAVDLSWLWPRACAACGTPCQKRLCAACVPRGRWAMRPPLPEAPWVVGLARYTTPFGRAVRRAKDRGDERLLGALAGLAAPGAADLAQGVHALVPAPSAPVSAAWRGFSPASVVCAAVSQAWGVPVVQAMRREGHRRQRGLGRDERLANLAGRLHRTARPLPGRVLIVDDVVTTGATVCLMAHALELAGAQVVGALALTLAGTPQATPREAS